MRGNFFSVNVLIVVFVFSFSAVYFYSLWPKPLFDPDECKIEKAEKPSAPDVILSEIKKKRVTDFKIHKTSAGLPERVMALPDLPGLYGHPNLREAMAKDTRLAHEIRARIEALQKKSLVELFPPDNSVVDEVKGIIYLWYNVEKIDPDGRGGFIDARDVAIMEVFSNKRILQEGVFPNIAPEYATYLKASFDGLFNIYYASLLAQLEAVDLYDVNEIGTGASYERGDVTLRKSIHTLRSFEMLGSFVPLPNNLQVTFDKVALGEVARSAEAVRDQGARLILWRNLLRMNVLLNSVIIKDPQYYHERLSNAIMASGASLTLRDVEAAANFFHYDPETKFLKTYDRHGRLVLRNWIVYNNEAGTRRVCYKVSKQPMINFSPMSDMLKFFKALKI